jgi:DNA helicase-2/ATP-dependent DNA helicase PcrA
LEFAADFHIHSRFSRATSRDLTLEALHASALEKGVTVLGTGDFTHPGWMEEIREKLVPAEEGLFLLREDLAREAEEKVPPACGGQVRFVLTSEISNIYKKDEQVRKVHNLLFSPSLETALQITGRLEAIGNIASDGRPILGLDSRNLLEIVLESSSDAFLVPAHIWTPWFSVLGSKSGFDSIDACFDDLVGEIFSVETGLSSDPDMNWRLSALDRFTLMSNSDAHSAAKVGREANRFDCELSFFSIKEALRNGVGKGFLGTVEFFPEQGKYHLDGHRKCGCRMEPRETLEKGGLCPVCGRKVTVGVMSRVEVLADRPEGERPPGAFPYDRLVSLAEVVGEVRGAAPQTKGVQKVYRQLLQRLGPELAILTQVPLEEIERVGGKVMAEGIRRMRQAEIRLEAGYDGEFGIVKLFRPEERAELEGQGTLAGIPSSGVGTGRPGKGSKEGRKKEASLLQALEESGAEPVDKRFAGLGISSAPLFTRKRSSLWSAEHMEHLNPEQRQAVVNKGGPVLIIAGPGTGKTLTLTYRIASLIEERGVPAERILAVTFTQRAAREMEERLRALLGASHSEIPVRIRTFHALGAEILREAGPSLGIPEDYFILGKEESAGLLRRAVPSLSRKEADALLEGISQAKRGLAYPEDGEAGVGDATFRQAYERYQEVLEEYRALDYDDLVARAVRLMTRLPDFAEKLAGRLSAVCVDEYQDVNLAQYRLLRLLSVKVEDLCAIGDPHQAIYGFRGATPAYFLQFKEDYPQGKVVQLIRNYRSTENVLSASLEMLSKGIGKDRIPSLVPTEQLGARVQVSDLSTEKAEAIFIAQTIERLMGGTDSLSFYADKVAGDEGSVCGSFGDIAILFRLKALAPGIEEALGHQGIPYQSVGQGDRMRGRQGRAILAVLRCLRNPEDRIACELIQGEFKQSPQAVQEQMEPYRRACAERRRSVQEWIEGIREFEWLDLEEESRKEAWEALVLMSLSFGSDWDGFMRALALSQDTDFLERKAERVTLATLHAAKGLEFPVVFIAGCEDLLLPCHVGGQEADLEEERRLFYVGMTRACRLLYLTRARSRFLYGERKSSPPSRFLEDIPRKRVTRVRHENRVGKKKREDPQMSLFKLPSQ